MSKYIILQNICAEYFSRIFEIFAFLKNRTINSVVNILHLLPGVLRKIRPVTPTNKLTDTLVHSQRDFKKILILQVSKLVPTCFK